jgi:hypothetical protein
MRRIFSVGIGLAAVLGAAGIAVVHGQQPGAAGAKPAAATAAPAAPARQVMVVPPGYEKVTAGGHTALAEPNDVAWVKQALGDVKPQPKPQNSPADMLKRLADNRAALTKQIVTDLALPDDKAVNEFLDTKLVTTLKKLDEIRPPVFFLVTTSDKLRDLTKTGWGEPRYHYNGVANSAAFDDNIAFSIDKPMDDVVLPAFFNDKDAADVRAKNLTAYLQNVDGNLALAAAQQAGPTVFNLFTTFIDEKQMEPLKLKRDQQWLGMGIANFLAVKYTGVVTAVPTEQMLAQLLNEEQMFPVSARSVDLLKPAETSSMREAMAPYYQVAMRRKATAVVAVWVKTAGEAAIPRTLTAIRGKMPADGAGLVKVIQDATGADLGKYLGAQ